MNLNETLSKALRKSINKSSPVMLFLLSYSITSYVVLMHHESRYSLGLSPLGIKDIMPIVCESGNLFISKLYE